MSDIQIITACLFWNRNYFLPVNFYTDTVCDLSAWNGGSRWLVRPNVIRWSIQ